MKKVFIAATAFALLLTGCTDEVQKKTFTPTAFGAHDRCNMCGMVIANYEGPKAQVFIKGAEETAVKFCSGRDAFTFALQPENARRLLAFFIHDVGSSSWEKPQDKDLMDARQAYYVYGHDIAGVMGNEPAAFSTQQAAREFMQKHGGKLYSYGDITLELLDK